MLGGATMRLFNKRGKLKTAEHHLRLWLGKEPDLKTPSSTPGKRPLAERGELGRLENLMKKYARLVCLCLIENSISRCLSLQG